MDTHQNRITGPSPRFSMSPTWRILSVVLCGIISAALLRSFIPADYAAFRSIPISTSVKTVPHMESGDEAPGGSADARPITQTQIVSCEELAHIPGKSVKTTTVEFRPNAYTPKHLHPGSVTVYASKARIPSLLGGGPIGVFGVGDSFFEPPGAIHLFAENASMTEPAEILVVFVADQDFGPLIIYDDP